MIRRGEERRGEERRGEYNGRRYGQFKLNRTEESE